MSPTRLMVFDLDGTLVDAFDDITAAANHALRALGHPETERHVIVARVGHGGRNLMQQLLPEGTDKTQIDAAFAAWRGYYLQHPCDLAKPYPGVVETIEAIRARGIKTAVLSNKSDDLIKMILEQLGLTPYFDHIQGERADLPKKPDPAVLEGIMEQFGVSADETLMVGDGVADIGVAVNAKVRAIGVDYGVTDAARLSELGAAVVLSDFQGVLEEID